MTTFVSVNLSGNRSPQRPAGEGSAVGSASGAGEGSAVGSASGAGEDSAAVYGEVTVRYDNNKRWAEGEHQSPYPIGL